MGMLVQTFVSNAIETFLNHRSRDYRISAPLLVVWGCVSLWGQDRALYISFQDRGSLLAFTWKIKVCAESLVYAAALETFSRLLLSLFCWFFFFLRIFFLVKKRKKKLPLSKAAKRHFFLGQILLCCVLFFIISNDAFWGSCSILELSGPPSGAKLGFPFWSETAFSQRMFFNGVRVQWMCVSRQTLPIGIVSSPLTSHEPTVAERATSKHVFSEK